MLHARFQYLALLWCGLTPLTGCVALSFGFGGKTQQVDTVVSESQETRDRINKLESRVQALEQQLTLPAPVPASGGPTLTP